MSVVAETVKLGYFAFADEHKAPVGTILGKTMPPHVTIDHWVETRTDPGIIIARAELAIQSLRRVTTIATERARFGKRDVTLLELTPELRDLHTALLATLDDEDTVIDEQYRGPNYNPHSSDKPGYKLGVGTPFEINDVDLVQRDQDGIRTVLHRLYL